MALLVATLVVAVLAARASGVRIAGTAITAPGVGAPAVGECLVALDLSPGAAVLTDGARSDLGGRSVPVIPGIDSNSATGSGTSGSGWLEEAAVRFGSCDGEHLGEVAAYRRMAPGPDLSADRTADMQWCASVAGDYQAHAQYQVQATVGPDWAPVTGAQFTAVLSTPRPDLREFRWAACLVVAPRTESYRGSYLRSLAIGPAPAPFGVCAGGAGTGGAVTGGPATGGPATGGAVTGGAESGGVVSCLTPHLAQDFGAVDVAPDATATSVDNCRGLVGILTGLDDPTAGGLFSVQVVDVSGPGELAGRRCRLTILGEGRLTASLLGIGGQPLPVG